MSARPLPPEERERRILAYQQFDTDRAAADALGIKMLTFRFWRRRSGLAAHHPHHSSLYTSSEKALVLALFRELGGKWPEREAVERWLR